MLKNLPDSWHTHLKEEFEQAYFQKLTKFVDEERMRYTGFPPEEDVCNALNYTQYEQVSVFLLFYL